MDIDERIMDKVLADVKEIVAEPDGTIRFIFYSSYSDEVENDTDDKIKTLRDVILAKERYITKLMSDIENRDATIKLLEEKLAGGKHD